MVQHDPNGILFLTEEEVQKVSFSMAEVLDILDDIYHEKAKGNYEMPAKAGVHPQEDSYLHAMPCWATKWETAGIKWGGGFRDNPKKGLRYINGMIVLNDVETGIPYVLMDCGYVTAVRTGGKSGLTAKYLARKDAHTVAMLACGTQARKALEAIHIGCPQVKRAICWDYFPQAAEKYAEEMRQVCPGLEIVTTTSVREALKDADIIHSAAPSGQHDISVVEKDMIKPGVLSVTMDIDVLWKKDAVVDNFTKFFTDEQRQFIYFRDDRHEVHGIPVLPDELCDMIAGKIPGRVSDTENIFAANIGIAFDDMPVADGIYKRAVAAGLGRMLPF